VSPMKYELGFYIPEDGTLLSHCSENLRSQVTGINCDFEHDCLLVCDSVYSGTNLLTFLKTILALHRG
jgi:hypothetical protein